MMQWIRNSFISVLYFWVILFALIPVAFMVLISFLQHTDQDIWIWRFSLENYTQLANYLYIRIFIQSFGLSFLITLSCLIIGYPCAYFIAQLNKRAKNLAVLFMILPFWTSSLIRTYAMLALLKTHGLINSLLMHFGIIHKPFAFLYSNFAVFIGSVYDLLPFMILPIFANIEKLNMNFLDAARDLGANKKMLFVHVVLPLTWPGILAGSFLVFLPAMTLFYIPAILGGSKSILLGNLIETQFLMVRNWPFGAAVSVALTVFVLILILFYRRQDQKKKEPIHMVKP